MHRPVASPLVLLAEDDPLHTAYVCDALAAAAPDTPVYTFSTAADALHGLAALTPRHPDQPAILAIDATALAGEWSGHRECLRRQRALRAVRIVALVNGTESAAIADTARREADDVLCRPADPMSLLQPPEPVTVPAAEFAA